MNGIGDAAPKMIKELRPFSHQFYRQGGNKATTPNTSALEKGSNVVEAATCASGSPTKPSVVVVVDNLELAVSAMHAFTSALKPEAVAKIEIGSETAVAVNILMWQY